MTNSVLSLLSQFLFVVVFFNITHCLLVNGVPDPSQCTSYATTNMTITVESLTPNTSYIFMITAQSVQYPDITSDTVEVEITTLGLYLIYSV